jgi:hypothetical protein
MPFLDALLTGDAVLGGEDDLVTGPQPVRPVRQGDGIGAQLTGVEAVVLCVLVEPVELVVGSVGKHHDTLTGMSRTGGCPVVDHPLARFGSGVLDVETAAGLVLAEGPFRVSLAELLPGVAFPLVVGAMDLAELRGRHVVFEFSEQPAGADR